VSIPPVLNVSSLSRRFGSVEAVSSVSFDVHEGENVGLLGPNGSGKTTTLHMLIGLLDSTEGSVAICGEHPREPSARRLVGMVPDDLPLPQSLTGNEFLDLHASLRGYADRELTRELLDLLGLTAHMSRPVGDYSHGMRRKIQFVSAVCHGPRLLVLDEPHRGLDPEASVVLQELIDVLRSSGVAVLTATHDLLRAERDCDRVVILHRGHTVAAGTPEELLALTGAPDLQHSFMILTGLAAGIQDARARIGAAVRHSTTSVV
jgi:ABC-2 type transport system ATP-binding protein